MDTARALVLAQICELRETADIKEVAQLLNGGNWIAICATTGENPIFSLGKLRERSLIVQVNK